MTISPDIRELAKSLYISGLPVSAIGAQLGLNPDTIKVWTVRYKWSALRNKVNQAVVIAREDKATREAQAIGVDRSSSVRDLLGQVVERQAQVLAQAPAADVAALADVNGKQGLARVAKTVAETASTVFDWASQRSAGLVIVGTVSQAEPDPVDVQAEVVDQNLPALPQESAKVST